MRVKMIVVATSKKDIARVPQLFVVDVDAEKGEYKVASSREPSKPHEGYSVNILEPSCSCPAGQHGFDNCKSNGVCKHVILARDYAAKIQAKLSGEAPKHEQLKINYVHLERM